MLEWKARLAYQILKLMHPVLNMFANTFTFVNNQFAAYIVKSHQEENIHPWLQESMEGVFSPKKSYFETLYGERYCGKN